jgi:uncharacterized membrane protein HdeD (DUF308 family)
MNTPTTQLNTAPQVAERRGRWKWFLALGVLLLVLGAAGVSIASVLEFTSVLVFGPLLLASSIIQLLTAFFAEKRGERLLHVAAAGLEAVLGFFIMANPLQRVIGLIALIALMLVIIGLVRLARSLAARSGSRGWTILAAVIAVLLGISIWIAGPAAKVSFVGLCIAADFLCHGVSWSALGLAERKAVQTPAAGGT